MKPFGLGETGDVSYQLKNGRTMALLYYRDYSGRRYRVTRMGDSRAALAGR